MHLSVYFHVLSIYLSLCVSIFNEVETIRFYKRVRFIESLPKT